MIILIGHNCTGTAYPEPVGRLRSHRRERLYRATHCLHRRSEKWSIGKAAEMVDAKLYGIDGRVALLLRKS
jgi:hypothetical protein